MLLAFSAHGDMSGTDAFNLGKSDGELAAPNVFSGVNTGNASTNIKHFGTTNPNESYFQGGIGDAVTPGGAKKLECAGPSAPTDPMGAKQCDAVNYLADLPAHTPALGITAADPLLQKGKAIRNDPAAFAANFASTYTACSTTSTATAGISKEQVCDDFLTLDDIVCQVNRVVTVAVDNTYQCLKQVTSLENQTCNRTVSATIQSAIDFVMPDGCMPFFGVWCQGDVSYALAGGINSGYAQGLPKLFVNGAYYFTVTAPFYSNWAIGAPGTYNVARSSCDWAQLQLNAVCSSVIDYNVIIGYDPWGNPIYGTTMVCGGGTAVYNFGRATQLSMCGTSQCTNMVRVVSSEGIVGYSCAASALAPGCPTGYTAMNTGSGPFCRENLYATYSTNPNCNYVGSRSIAVPGTAAATQHLWACPTITNGCAVLESRAL